MISNLILLLIRHFIRHFHFRSSVTSEPNGVRWVRMLPFVTVVAV